MAGRGARLAQQPEIRGEQHARDRGREIEQAAPAVARREQRAHRAPREGIADQVAHAQDADDGAMRRVVEPARRDLEESRPGDRLRQAVAEPGEREYGQGSAQREHQRERRRAREADEEIDAAAPVVAEPGEEQLAERVGEDAVGTQVADAHERGVRADSAPAQFPDQQRRRDGQVRTAEIERRVAAEQQDDRRDLPGYEGFAAGRQGLLRHGWVRRARGGRRGRRRECRCGRKTPSSGPAHCG